MRRETSRAVPGTCPVTSATNHQESEMPRGPEGQKRPHGTVEAAVMVAKIATGEVEEDLPDGRRKSGQKTERFGSGV